MTGATHRADKAEATLGSLQLDLAELKADHARLEGKIDVVNEKIDGVKDVVNEKIDGVNEKIDGVKGSGKVALYILIPFFVGIMGLLGAIIAK